MAVFRCLRSGNTISLTREDDIARLRKQENYKEVLSESAIQAQKSSAADRSQDERHAEAFGPIRKIYENDAKNAQGQVLKGRGRPRKAA